MSSEHKDVTARIDAIVIEAFRELLDKIGGVLNEDQMFAAAAILRSAVIQGMRMGVAEATAQLLEQGADVNLRINETNQRSNR